MSTRRLRPTKSARRRLALEQRRHVRRLARLCPSELRFALQCQCRGASAFADRHDIPELGICPRFECARCHRQAPWCMGGSDSNICDPCWCVVTASGERELPQRWDLGNAEYYGDQPR